MTALIPFKFNTSQIRVVVDDNGSPWFVAKEVAAILGYSDAHKMVARLDDDEKSNRQIGGLGSPTGGRGIICINESGLYACVLASKKPEAKPFRKWVTSEVLPAIRKTGAYDAKAAQWEVDPFNPAMERHKFKPGRYRPTAAARAAHQRVDGAAKALTAAETETAMRLKLSSTRFLMSFDFTTGDPCLKALSPATRVVDPSDPAQLGAFISGLNEGELSTLYLHIWKWLFGKEGPLSVRKASEKRLALALRKERP